MNDLQRRNAFFDRGEVSTRTRALVLFGAFVAIAALALLEVVQ